MASTYELIASQTLGSSAAYIEFTSIPGTFDDIALALSVRGTQNIAGVYYTTAYIQFNTSASGYSYRDLRGTGSAVASGSASSQTRLKTTPIPVAQATSSTFGNCEVYVPNYAGSANKSVSVTGVTENNGTAAAIEGIAGLWANTSAITSIKFYVLSDSLEANSSAYLYGVSHA